MEQLYLKKCNCGNFELEHIRGIKIKQDDNKLSKEEIEKMIEDAEKFKQEDEARANNIQSRNKLESMLYDKKYCRK